MNPHTWQEAWHVNKGNQGDIEGVTETDKPGSLGRREEEGGIEKRGRGWGGGEGGGGEGGNGIEDTARQWKRK